MKWLLRMAIFAAGIYVAYEHPDFAQQVYVYSKQFVNEATVYVNQLIQKME